jgi:hypothetical protein
MKNNLILVYVLYVVGLFIYFRKKNIRENLTEADWEARENDILDEKENEFLLLLLNADQGKKDLLIKVDKEKKDLLIKVDKEKKEALLKAKNDLSNAILKAENLCIKESNIIESQRLKSIANTPPCPVCKSCCFNLF